MLGHRLQHAKDARPGCVVDANHLLLGDSPDAVAARAGTASRREQMTWRRAAPFRPALSTHAEIYARHCPKVPRLSVEGPITMQPRKHQAQSACSAWPFCKAPLPQHPTGHPASLLEYNASARPVTGHEPNIGLALDPAPVPSRNPHACHAKSIADALELTRRSARSQESTRLSEPRSRKIRHDTEAQLARWRQIAHWSAGKGALPNCS